MEKYNTSIITDIQASTHNLINELEEKETDTEDETNIEEK